MTISTTASTVTHNCNGVTTTFAIPFKFEKDADIAITRIEITSGDELLIVTDYTISGAGSDSGGSVTFGGAFSALFQVRIDRNTAQLQPVDLVDNDGFDAETTEEALDRLTMMVQDVDRSLSVLAVGASGLSVGNELDVSGFGGVVFYSEVVGGVNLLRRLVVGSDSLQVGMIDRQYAVVGTTGLFVAEGAYLGSDTATESNGAFLAAIQTKAFTGSPAVVFWDYGSSADAGKWAIHHPAASVLSIGASTDDMTAISELLRFTRSGANAASVRLAVLLDANAKRIGNVGTLDFDEQDKGNVTGNVTFDFSAYNTIKATFTGNVTATFTAPNGPTTTYIEITQDGAGSKTIAFPASVKWTAATVAGDKLLSTGANKRDLVVLKWNGAGTAALAQIFKDW